MSEAFLRASSKKLGLSELGAVCFDLSFSSGHDLCKQKLSKDW